MGEPQQGMALSTLVVSARRVSSPRCCCVFFCIVKTHTHPHTHILEAAKKKKKPGLNHPESWRVPGGTVVASSSPHHRTFTGGQRSGLYNYTGSGCGQGLCLIPGSVKLVSATHPKGGSTCWAPWEGRTDGGEPKEAPPFSVRENSE